MRHFRKVKEECYGGSNDGEEDDDGVSYLYSIYPYFKVILCPNSLTGYIGESIQPETV